MLEIKAKSIASQVKDCYNFLHKRVYQILLNSDEYAYTALENEIFNELKDKDITFSQLLIVEAYEEYLHNQISLNEIRLLKEYDQDKIKKGETDPIYVPSEDAFLRLTHYINYHIFYLKFPELQIEDEYYRTPFNVLNDLLGEFVKTYNEFEASFTKDDETEHACEQIYTSFEKYTIDKLKELQIYIISLLDQIGDNNVKIFTIGERIEEKYSIKYMLDIMAVRSLITAYLHQKYKENEEKGNGRVRTNDSDTNNELPYEI